MNAPTKIAPYDVEAIRRDFPILSRTVYGKPLVYLDNGASAQKPQAMIDAVTQAYGHEYSNVHRGLHFLSNAATEKYEEAREAVRRFLNAAQMEEILFTRNSTEAINLVAASYGALAVKEGDEIVLSIMEHHSNIVPWHFLRERKGAVIKWAPVADDGTFILEEFETLLSPRTKMVAITHMSNVLGTVVPIKEVVRLAHARGIPVLVDGSQGAVHLPVDVRDLDCDFYCFTGHKLYGPTGIGVLYGKREWLQRLPPYMGGGEMIRDVTEDLVTYADPPHRFEAGTPPILEAIGLAAAIEWLGGLDRDAVVAHERGLYDRVKERLNGANWLTEIGQAPGKGAIFSFVMEGAHAHDIAQILDRYGVAVRAGTHCAEPLLARYGLTSSARASFALYNTLDEADSFVEALFKTRTFFS
jgi:cysteine desulfurase / selenocysteine lyase